MQPYAVHLFTQVRVKITGIQAQTMEQAMEKAESQVNLRDLLENKALLLTAVNERWNLASTF